MRNWKEAVNLRIPNYEWSPRPHFLCQLEQNSDLGPVLSVLNGAQGDFTIFFYHFTIFGSHSVIWVIGSLLIVTETTFFILAGAKSGFRTSIQRFKWGLGRFYIFLPFYHFWVPQCNLRIQIINCHRDHIFYSSWSKIWIQNQYLILYIVY